jgi:hypothetical protein
VNYRDMNEAQQLDWGRAEAALRIADLAVKSAEGLKTAQANAEMRRKVIDATVGQAADMVIRANREARVAKATGAAQ